MKDLPLICAHLLGGTSGLNLSRDLSEAEIQALVASAMRVAREIERQAKKASPPAIRKLSPEDLSA